MSILASNSKWDDNFGRALNGDIRLNFTSRINLAELPSNLRVTPVLYPEIFGYDAQEALQEMSNRKFRTDNNVLIIKTFPKVGIDLHASMGFTADLQKMTSGLYGHTPASTDCRTPPDSLSNDTDYRRFEARANLGMTYRHRDFSISTGISPIYSNIIASDHISGDNKHRDRVFFNPHIGLDWKITPNLSFLASGNIIGNLGAASGIYSGYIMTDYRMIGSTDGRIAEGSFQNYSAELRYADALLSLFGSVKADYRRSDSNLMYGWNFPYFGIYGDGISECY